MIPTEFPEQNIIWAKDQSEYLPLPAITDDTYTVTCWALSWRERLRMLWFGRLWLVQRLAVSAALPKYCIVRRVKCPPIGRQARTRTGCRRVWPLAQPGLQERTTSTPRPTATEDVHVDQRKCFKTPVPSPV